MDGTEIMIAIGIGCRGGASKEAILALVTEARTRIVEDEMPALFTYEGKRNEDGLTAAARALSLPLTYLSREALLAMADKITTRSEAAEKALGIPSVAEAAALAGCGEGAQLRVPRLIGDGVTCAIATSTQGSAE
jgi:cobalt-precorrin 5A hydrolase